MRHHPRRVLARVVPVLAALAFLATVPGCGDAASKPGAAAGGPPPNVQESNKNMENFMKSQGAKK